MKTEEKLAHFRESHVGRILHILYQMKYAPSDLEIFDLHPKGDGEKSTNLLKCIKALIPVWSSATNVIDVRTQSTKNAKTIFYNETRDCAVILCRISSTEFGFLIKFQIEFSLFL